MGTLVQFEHSPDKLEDIIPYLERYEQTIAKLPFSYTPHLDYGCISLSDDTGSVHLEAMGVACLRGSWSTILKKVEKVFFCNAIFLENP